MTPNKQTANVFGADSYVKGWQTVNFEPTSHIQWQNMP